MGAATATAPSHPASHDRRSGRRTGAAVDGYPPDVRYRARDRVRDNRGDPPEHEGGILRDNRPARDRCRDNRGPEGGSSGGPGGL